jgi:hypothetical protein
VAIDHVHSTSAHAHMLVKALENVILPIIHAYAPGLGEKIIACLEREQHLTYLFLFSCRHWQKHC